MILLHLPTDWKAQCGIACGIAIGIGLLAIACASVQIAEGDVARWNEFVAVMNGVMRY